MASWLRLWHEMPNDPKWRTIARVASQPIALVQATYLHLLVCASRNVTRGHADVTIEDLASALDVTDDAISAVLEAMQGRVLDGFTLTGWNKRQPAREDAVGIENGAKTAAERKREQREREREAAHNAQCHEMSRNVTQCHAPDTDTDTDTDTEKKKDQKKKHRASARSPDKPADVSESVWIDFNAIRKAKRAPLTSTALESIRSEAGKAGMTLESALAQCCARGWQGFKADWMARASPQPPPRYSQQESERDIRSRAKREFWEQINGKRSAVPAAIDGEAVRVD